MPVEHYAVRWEGSFLPEHNEVYTFTAADSAEFNYSAAITKVVRLRESMRGYVGGLFANYSQTGEPVMRPMFYDFPTDRACATPAAGDQYMFGPLYLVAPILEMGARNRSVYFPDGASWKHLFTEQVYRGGSAQDVAAPLDELPVFTRQ